MQKKTIREQLESGVLVRDLPIDKRSIDEEARTIEISFSSENPITRWGESEILDHSGGSVRLDRAKSDGPLLMDHNWSDQIGTIDEIGVADRVGRAVVRFGKSARATEIFNDVIDGIRKSISVGYRIYKVIHEQMSEDEPDVYRVMDWEPLEISFVSVPADVSIGVGRTADGESKNNYELIREVEEMLEENKPADNGQPVVTAEERQAAIDEAIKADRELEVKRVAGINKLARLYDKQGDHRELVSRALSDGTSVEDFAQEIADAEIDKRKDDTPNTELGLSDQDVQRFSVTRALLAAATGNWKDAEFERECSNQVADNLGIEARGVLIPFEIQNRKSAENADGQRVVTTTTGGVGLVGTDHLGGSFIDNLRDQSIVMQMGAQSLSGLRGNIDIPRKTENATFGWVGEGDDTTLSNVVVGTLSMSPKTVTGGVEMTRRTLLQSNPDIDALVLADMAQGMALAVDIAALAGAAGGDNPIGILNTTGVLTQAVATAGQPTWGEIVSFETVAAGANSLMGGSKFVTTAGVRGHLKTTPKDAGSGIFLASGNQTNGYDIMVKTDAGFPANTILFGDFTQFLVGMWGVLDLVPDMATKAASGGMVIRAFQDMDFAVRQPTAFVKNV